MTRSIKKNKQFLEVEALKYSVVERRKGRDLVGQAACTLHESPRAEGFQEPFLCWVGLSRDISAFESLLFLVNNPLLVLLLKEK